VEGSEAAAVKAGLVGPALAALAPTLFARSGGTVITVSRPNREDRCSRGKSDLIKAINTPRAVLSESATTTPKSHDGHVESVRQICAIRRGAVKACRLSTASAGAKADAQIFHHRRPPLQSEASLARGWALTLAARPRATTWQVVGA
jgi:hypothetical protein